MNELRLVVSYANAWLWFWTYGDLHGTAGTVAECCRQAGVSEYWLPGRNGGPYKA
jgi:hypothetical protein